MKIIYDRSFREIKNFINLVDEEFTGFLSDCCFGFYNYYQKGKKVLDYDWRYKTEAEAFQSVQMEFGKNVLTKEIPAAIIQQKMREMIYYN